MGLGLLQLWEKWKGAGWGASSKAAMALPPLVLPFSSSAKPRLMFFQHFAQIRRGRSPMAMEGRAGLCKEPCAACSGALPNTRRPMLYL